MLHPVQLFKILSDETRLNIVMLLSAAAGESQPKISRHIALLREHGLVVDRRQGKWIHYRLSPQMPAWAAATIETTWNCLRDEVSAKLSAAPAGSC